MKILFKSSGWPPELVVFQRLLAKEIPHASMGVALNDRDNIIFFAAFYQSGDNQYDFMECTPEETNLHVYRLGVDNEFKYISSKTGGPPAF
ncbi:hypothetical protein AHAT_19120 [Agarivorans sp. Toyoura001]|nr:hypothetical protein AHAT_19120 [Agarivorans sp. Toyoura001]